MQYEALFEKSSTLPQGRLTLEFVRCHHSDAAWNASDVESLHELSVQYFSKHGRNENGKPTSCWIDCGQDGLAVRVKTDNIALQRDRVVKYRFNLRRSFSKILKLRSSSPAESNGPERETFEVYVPVTDYVGHDLHADMFLEYESDPERRRSIIETMPGDICIRIPSQPFRAVKMRVYGEGEPLLTSVSGEDMSISFMTREKAEQCGVAESTEQVEEFFPPSKQPEIEKLYRKTMEKRCCPSDPPLERDAGNPDVPPPVLNGTTSESTEKLGASTASAGIAPNVESKELDCLPRNYRSRSRSPVEPATVAGISSALEQSAHAVRRRHQNTLSDTVAEKNAGNPNVPTPVLDGTNAIFSRRESTEILGAPSLLAASAGIAPNIECKKVDCLPLNSQGHSQSSAVTVTAVSGASEPVAILNSRQSFDVVRSGNQNTILPNSDTEKNTGNPDVPHLVVDGTTPRSSGHVTTASDGIALNVESKKVDCLPLNSQNHWQSSSNPATAISNAFDPMPQNSPQSFHGVRSGNQNTTLPNSVVCPLNNRMTSRPPISDSSVAVSPVEQSFDVSFTLKKLLAARRLFVILPSEKVDLDSKDINTLIHGSVRTQVCYGTIAVSVPVRKEGRSIVCYTPSYDKDEVLRFIEYSPVNLMIFTRMERASSVLMALTKFHNSMYSDFEATQLLKLIIDGFERRKGVASVIPELPKSSQQNHHRGILRAVAELSAMDV